MAASKKIQLLRGFILSAPALRVSSAVPGTAWICIKCHLKWNRSFTVRCDFMRLSLECLLMLPECFQGDFVSRKRRKKKQAVPLFEDLWSKSAGSLVDK